MNTLSVTDEHFAQMQELASMGSWELDVRTSDLRWSAACYRIFGIPTGTEMTYERFLAAVHPEDRAAVEDAWAAALEGAEYDLEHRIVVDGETR
ncbi:MAG: PAS domain-containing protein [Halanaeroarchaeum sp.]